MDNQDRIAIERSLEKATQSCNLSQAYSDSKEMASLCATANNEIEHPAWDEVANRIAKMSDEHIADIIRVGTARFHLLNKAEQLNIIRVNQQRQRDADSTHPRAESIEDALIHLKGLGCTQECIVELINDLDIEPTLTAHPTETRRRTILDKQTEVARCIVRLRDEQLTKRQREETMSELDRIIAMMLMTDEIRAQRLGVEDEVKNGIYFLTTTIWETVPQLFRDIVSAARSAYGSEEAMVVANDLPAILRYRTWIGGDRDGNPSVTAQVTRQTMTQMRNAAILLWDAQLANLRHILSVSTRRVDLGTEIHSAVEQDIDWITDQEHYAQRRHEPIRVRLTQMRARIESDPTYNAECLVEDLQIIRRALKVAGLMDHAECGPLSDAIVRAKVFGLHLATLDIRQHSQIHNAAVSELLNLAGVCSDFEEQSEQDKLTILRQEIHSARPLTPINAQLSDPTAQVLETLRVVFDAVESEPDSIQSWIISMTHHVSDMLSVLLLMKEVGLYRPPMGTHPAMSMVHIVPLFETIDDLELAPSLMDSTLTDSVFLSHLNAVNQGNPIEQEVMLGYSDSNKDGGFLMANVALANAQREIAEVFKKHNTRLRYFHGRGGTIGRGGGRAGRAILAAPQGAQTGRLRFTEQGEVITFRYALPEMAHRHLEQIIHASLLASSKTNTPPRDIEFEKLAYQLACAARDAYRTLIDDPEFWDWFIGVSPINHIGAMPIASRPVSRATGSDLTFESLRAIPWVFSWGQMRALVPGWYGIGTAIKSATQDQRDQLEQAAKRPFVSTIFENAAQEMARARMPILRRYAMMSPEGLAMFERIQTEFDLTKSAILNATNRKTLMDHSPVVGRSIEDRNPWTDILNLAQIELLKRFDNADEEQIPQLKLTLHASINAIASAMQSTG